MISVDFQSKFPSKNSTKFFLYFHPYPRGPKPLQIPIKKYGGIARGLETSREENIG
jgi:hypothetical protein